MRSFSSTGDGSRSRRQAYPTLAAAVACVSLGSILVRLAAAPPLAVAFHRVFLASLLLAPFVLGASWRSWRSLDRAQAVLLLASGAALALHFATWIASLDRTSVAVSVLLVNLAPVSTIALSWAFLREAPTRRLLGATAVALLGATLIAAGDWTGGGSLAGATLALAGAVTLSAHHVIGRGLRAALPLGPYVLAAWTVAALVLWVLARVADVPLVGHPPRALAAFLALAVVPTLGGHGLVNRSLRLLPAPVVGLFLLGEPVGASVLAYLLFAEVPGAWTVSGGLLVLAALAVVVTSPAAAREAGAE